MGHFLFNCVNGDGLKTDRISDDPFFPFFIGTMLKKNGSF